MGQSILLKCFLFIYALRILLGLFQVIVSFRSFYLSIKECIPLSLRDLESSLWRVPLKVDSSKTWVVNGKLQSNELAGTIFFPSNPCHHYLWGMLFSTLSLTPKDFLWRPSFMQVSLLDSIVWIGSKLHHELLCTPHGPSGFNKFK